MLRLTLYAQRLAAACLRNEDGQGLTEYALIITLVAVIAIASVGLFGGKVTVVLSSVARSL